MKKINKKALTLIICAAMLLSGCTAAENPAVTESTTPIAAIDTQQDGEQQTNAESPAPSITTKKETALLPEESAESNTTTPEQQTEAPPSETVPPEPAGSVSDDYREDGENGIKIIGRNGHYMGLMGCWGTFERCDAYVAALNRAAAALPDVNVYSTVIPTSSEFYTPDDVTGFTASQKEKIGYIAESLSGIQNVDVYAALEAHTEEPIYTRTDHHWQPLGAYYAAQAFAGTAGVSDLFKPLSDYTKVEKGGYVGSLYNYSKSENLNGDPETFTMYISPNDGNLKTTYYDTAFQNGYDSDLFVSRDGGGFYCSFLGSDDRIAKIETDCGNGKTLVIFKESYGNALVPFLTTCYQNIYVCDVRYFDIDAVTFCKDVGATDLLFAVCTFTPAGPNCKYVEEMF